MLQSSCLHDKALRCILQTASVRSLKTGRMVSRIKGSGRHYIGLPNGARSVVLPVLHRWARTCRQTSVRQASPRQMQVRALTTTSWKKLLLWQTRAAELSSRMLVTLLSVLFYYYPSLLTTILSLFACYRIDPEFPAADELYPQYAQVSLPFTHHLSLLCAWMVTCIDQT